MATKISPQVAAILEQTTKFYNDMISRMVDDPQPVILTGPARPEDLVLLAAALASVTQGMDDEGQYGSTYHWSDVVCASIDREVEEGITDILELIGNKSVVVE